MITSQKKSTANAANNKMKARKIKQPTYKSFRLSKRIKHTGPNLPSAFKIFKASVVVLKKYWRGFAGIAAAYLVLSLILVRGFAGSDLPLLKDLVTQNLQGKGGDITVGFTVFGLLLGTTGQASSQVGGVYQSMLLVGVSLAIIWALRQAHAGTRFGVKEAFYKAFYPLVPFLGVLLVIGLQLLPLLAANALYNVIFLNNVAQTLPEQFAWAVLMVMLVLWSLYMLASSLFALYIVTLPDMPPLKALRSARELVRHRRWTVLRKVLFLPFILLIIGVAVMLPVILFATPIAEWVFVSLTTIILVAVHSYMYGLYRELL